MSGGETGADHLALMARAGLMTHVAELSPPVTAEAMARFRSDAAKQASNVMALASGRFALCLPPGRREIATTVAHRLRPIDDAGRNPAPDAEAAAGAAATPRRILPPGLRPRGAEAPVGTSETARAATVPHEAAPPRRGGTLPAEPAPAEPEQAEPAPPGPQAASGPPRPDRPAVAGHAARAHAPDRKSVV